MRPSGEGNQRASKEKVLSGKRAGCGKKLKTRECDGGRSGKEKTGDPVT